MKQPIGNATIPLTCDPHCLNDVPNGYYEPMLIMSLESTMNSALGHNKSEKVALAVDGKEGIGVISKESRDCMWDEIMIHKKGLSNMRDRFGPIQSLHQFKLECLNETAKALTRLRTKHSLTEWSCTQTAKDLVLMLDEHIADVNSLVADGNYE